MSTARGLETRENDSNLRGWRQRVASNRMRAWCGASTLLLLLGFMTSPHARGKPRWMGCGEAEEAAGAMPWRRAGGGEVWASKGQAGGREAVALRSDSAGRDIRRERRGCPAGVGCPQPPGLIHPRFPDVSHLWAMQTHGMIWQRGRVCDLFPPRETCLSQNPLTVAAAHFCPWRCAEVATRKRGSDIW